MTSVKPGGVVEFRFYRPEAREVVVAGDFNRWSESALPMTSSGDGWWIAHKALSAGEYRFRYLADGHWFTDFAAYGIEPTNFGANSVLVVSKALAAKRPAPELKPDVAPVAPVVIRRENVLREQVVSS